MAVRALLPLAAVALFLAAGSGLAELLPNLRRKPLVRRLAYAYLLGVAWVAGGLWALSHFAAVPLRRPAILALAAAPVLAGAVSYLWRRGWSRRRRPRLPWRLRLLIFLAAAVGGFLALGLFAEALTNPPTDWDGRMTWSAQARYLRAAGTVDAEILQRKRWYVDHPRYPPLLPLAQAAAMELLGSGEDAAVYRPLYAAFFPVFLLLAYDGARRWVGRRPAAWTALAAAVVPFLSLDREGGAAGEYSDLPLACFYGAALLLLLKARPRAADGIAAGLLLGAALLTKNEGVLLAGFALAIAFGTILWRRRSARTGRRLAPVALAALLALAAFALLASWRAGIPNRFDEEYAKRLADLWPAAWERLPLLVPPILGKMIAWRDWTLFWWMLPVIFLAGRRGLVRGVSLPLAAAAAAPLAIGWGAYLVHWNPVYLISVTWNRLLLQGSVPLLVLLAMALAGCLPRE
ncbi:MAG TPA: hypothetical protein VOA87_20100 [Thermoanaerobaculia bacterium]|nr:hypothetical protein [Thermoanaerobaculia bacterium]